MARASIRADLVIELGAGTGPVTRALLQRHPANSVIAVELQSAMASGLRKAFPHVRVEQAPASRVLDASQFEGKRVALVSSLPFRSLPAVVRDETVASIASFLRRHPDSWLVQFTYQPRCPFTAPEGFSWKPLEQVWRNLPPAGVWALRAD